MNRVPHNPSPPALPDNSPIALGPLDLDEHQIQTFECEGGP